MANNPGLFNAALNGGIGGSHNRWITNPSDSGYLAIRQAITSLATTIDALIDADPNLSDADARLMQSVVQGVIAGRYPRGILNADYASIAQSIVVLWEAMRAQLVDENFASFEVVPQIFEEIDDFTDAVNGSSDAFCIGDRNWFIDQQVGSFSVPAPGTIYTGRCGIQQLNPGTLSTNLQVSLKRDNQGTNSCSNSSYMELMEAVIGTYFLASNCTMSFGWGRGLLTHLDANQINCVYITFQPNQFGPNFVLLRKVGGSVQTFNTGVPAVPDPANPTFYLLRLQRDADTGEIVCQIFDTLGGTPLGTEVRCNPITANQPVNRGVVTRKVTNDGTCNCFVDWIHTRMSPIQRLGRQP